MAAPDFLSPAWLYSSDCGVAGYSTFSHRVYWSAPSTLEYQPLDALIYSICILKYSAQREGDFIVLFIIDFVGI